MEIMKLTNVPELTEFAGTEKIYVNDNGTTKQIACDKVVTGGGSSSEMVIIGNGRYLEYEEYIELIEAGADVWYSTGSALCKVLAWTFDGSCGSGRYLKISYVAGATAQQIMLGLVFDTSLIDRLEALL